jgi:hypothetical protein
VIFVAKSKNSVGFKVALIALAFAAIPVGAALVQNPVYHQSQAAEVSTVLIPGWNLVSFPVKTNLMARDLCEMNPSILGVDRQHHSSNDFWFEIECGAEAKGKKKANFPIKSDKAYFIKSESHTTLTVTGEPITTAPESYNWRDGWNLVGLPVIPEGVVTVEDFCDGDLLRQPNRKVVSFDRWLNGGWDAHLCDFPWNDFELEPGVGYAVRVTKE